MSRTPTTWAEALDRLAYVLGGRSDGPRAEAREWVEEALEASWGVRSLHDVSRPRRLVAFQRTVGVTLYLEEQGEVAFALDLRRIVAAAFARYWKGVALDGPPWRLTPYEDRPSRASWVEESAESADFDAPAPSQREEAVTR